MTALKPCPFCGSTTTSTQIMEDHCSFVACEKCDAIGPLVDNDPEGDKAEAAWNTRTNIDARLH